MNTLTTRPPTIDQVATVLETAADLYESEKIQWCEGIWAKVPGSWDNPDATISACAEGALLLAAGFTAVQVARRGKHLFPESELAMRSVRALKNVINQGRLDEDHVSVHFWNDNQIGNRKPVVCIDAHGGTYQDKTAPQPPLPHAQVVQHKKQAPQDLRNRGEVDDK